MTIPEHKINTIQYFRILTLHAQLLLQCRITIWGPVVGHVWRVKASLQWMWRMLHMVRMRIFSTSGCEASRQLVAVLDSDSDALSQVSNDEHEQQQQDISDPPKRPLQVNVSNVPCMHLSRQFIFCARCLVCLVVPCQTMRKRWRHSAKSVRIFWWLSFCPRSSLCWHLSASAGIKSKQ